MKTIAILAMLFGCFISVSAQSPRPSSTSSNSLVLYDDFNGPRIDPAKWDDVTQSIRMFEAVRELSPSYQGEGNNGLLHISQRAYSATWNDDGDTYGYFGLQFINPASVLETSFTVAVNRATISNCRSNYSSGGSAAWAGFTGRFFNYSGQASGDQDVSADIKLTRDPGHPSGPLVVSASIASGDGVVFNYQEIGSVSLGQTAKLRVKWDRVNSRFLFQLNTNQPVAMTYSVPDTFPPFYSVKWLWIGRGTPNCTTTPLGSAMIDANFDNVYVNSQ